MEATPLEHASSHASPQREREKALSEGHDYEVPGTQSLVKGARWACNLLNKYFQKKLGKVIFIYIFKYR